MRRKMWLRCKVGIASPDALYGFTVGIPLSVRLADLDKPDRLKSDPVGSGPYVIEWRFRARHHTSSAR